VKIAEIEHYCHFVFSFLTVLFYFRSLLDFFSYAFAFVPNFRAQLRIYKKRMLCFPAEKTWLHPWQRKFSKKEMEKK